jgi:hypothetical protein
LTKGIDTQYFVVHKPTVSGSASALSGRDSFADPTQEVAMKLFVYESQRETDFCIVRWQI